MIARFTPTEGDQPGCAISAFFESELHLAADQLSFSVVGQRLSHEYLDLPSPFSRFSLRASVHGSSAGDFCKSEKPTVPRIGETSYGRVMELKDKLQMLMARHALNGQKLARSSHVSDSEISRILQGKSRPGLDNAFRLARSVGVTLDYLADDSLDVEPPRPEDHLSAEERRILSLAQKIGCSQVITILENIRFLGYEVAMSRLVGGKPIIEVDKELADHRPGMAAAGAPATGAPSRANSVSA
jgi:transcriptional regulator with XRE-family HTH domain